MTKVILFLVALNLNMAATPVPFDNMEGCVAAQAVAVAQARKDYPHGAWDAVCIEFTAREESGA